MSDPKPSPNDRSQTADLVGGILVSLLFAALFYLVLWITVFDAVTSALAASGVGVVLLTGAAASDTISAIIEAIAEAVGAVFAAIGAALAAVFSIFS